MAEYDAIVIGAGPSGSSAAYFMARSGAKVAVLEKKQFPRAKTCGDGWTPRAIKVLDDIGISTDSMKRVTGLRVLGGGRTLELDFPKLSNFRDYGLVRRRSNLDAEIAQAARAAGAEFIHGVEAVAPVTSGGEGSSVTGVRWVRRGRSRDGGVTKIDEGKLDSKFVVVADGATSSFGRALGVRHRPGTPMGLAIRSYYETPRGSDEFFESWLQLRKGERTLPGYGWLFPLGDGTVNVGVGVPSTFGAWRDVNLNHLQHDFIDMLPRSYGISHEGQLEKYQSGRLPMAGGVDKPYGNGYIVVGDAASMVNPFNGEGIAYALETGKLGASLLAEALKAGSTAELAHYREALHDIYGAYYRLGRLFSRVIGRPWAFSLLTVVGMRWRPLMVFALQLLGNLAEDEGGRFFDRAFRGIVRLAEKELEELPEPQIPSPPIATRAPKAGAA